MFRFKSPYKMSREEFLDYEEPKPDVGYRLLYHETSNENIEDIIKHGITLSKSRYKETQDVPNTIWASTDPKGWYGKHPLVIFQVPINEKEPTVEYTGDTVMIHRDISPENIVSIDPVYHTDLGTGRLSFFRNNEYAPIYFDEIFGIKKEIKYSLKEIFLNEFNALSTAAIEASNVSPENWKSNNAPRVDEDKYKKNEELYEKLGLMAVTDKKGKKIYISHMDPQYKRQTSIIKNIDDIVEYEEPNYLEPSGDHRISELGYSKIADRNNDLNTDIYLAPYDPNWKRSMQMVNLSKSRNNITLYDIEKHDMFEKEPLNKMFSEIKKEWDNIKKFLNEENKELKFYHGTNLPFEPGDIISPPIETGNISEKGRKRNLDKVFFTTDVGSAKIYAGRARASMGSGRPYIYEVEPMGEVEWLNKNPGTTVAMAPKAKVIKMVL